MTTYKQDVKTKEDKDEHLPRYFDLRLGGSETCTCCAGSGRK